jgi:hypothetical protein
MPPEEATTVVVTETEPPEAPESTAEIDAAQAAASANSAAEAAAASIAMADVVAARAADAAANDVAAYEGRLAECQEGLRTATQRLDASDAAAAELRSQTAQLLTMLESIQSRLAPPPERPTNPEPGQSGATDGPATPEGDPPPEPQQPARRRAHRWI